MASTSGECSSGVNSVVGNNVSGVSSIAVPQWKRDLIQRRRQQNKAATSSFLENNSCHGVVDESRRTNDICHDYQGCNQQSVTSLAATSLNSHPSCGATAQTTDAPSRGESPNESDARESATATPSSVACNMRLEADVSSSSLLFCAGDESVSFNGTRNNNQNSMTISALGGVSEGDFANYEDDNMRNYGNGLSNNPNCKRAINRRDSQDGDNDNRGIASRIIRRMDDNNKSSVFLYPCEQTNKSRCDGRTSVKTRKMPGNGKIMDECESDSSEELQYGPGIVNRLKSKYLNLTLREMNKTRTCVQRFRRAASLEDLLDCDDGVSVVDNDKTARKYAKRSNITSKTTNERYRNSSRGNESMKRARSVETLMRYNNNNASIASDETTQRLPVTLRQEPVNDHIVLIDRSSVKIESRLADTERPKAVNKPKRIKPLLAETERPPADLVKTTMRLFEGSVKKFKPKGEVAVKVATFKTINDTYKQQTAAMKKLSPKPPIQPKPFVNGKISPKKQQNTTKPTAEIIENNDEEYRNDCVVTEPIVQSVSSVVSKFRQIEQSSSPEPNFKVKFSPAPSPEPMLHSKMTKNDAVVKSPPLSPKKEATRQLSPVNSIPTNRQIAAEVTKETPMTEEVDLTLKTAEKRDIESMEISISEDRSSESIESVDGTRTISKVALENISKAGITMEYNFGDKSSIGKSYLPGFVTHNGEKSEITKQTNGHQQRNIETTKIVEKMASSPEMPSSSSPMSLDSIDDEQTTRLNAEEEKSFDARSNDRTTSPIVAGNKMEYGKIGAISSLGLIKSSTSPTSTCSYPVLNENTGKTMIRSQKCDISPPQKQIGIIRPLVSTKTQIPQQNLSNRELEKNLINRVKSIEQQQQQQQQQQTTKVVVSLKSAEDIQPVKKIAGSPVSGGGGGLWDTKPWNQANNTMVFNFSNRKDVPDYIENDGLIIRRKREKSKVGDGGVIVLDATLDASTTDDSDWEISGGPPSPCDVSFTNDNVLINGRSNLSKQPRNHKHRIQFNDGATRTFEYPSEASMLEDEGTSVDGDTSSSTSQQSSQGGNKSTSVNSAATMSSALLGGGGLSNFTPSKVDLASEGFELGVTRTAVPTSSTTTTTTTNEQQTDPKSNEECKSAEDAAAWGTEATADLLY